MSGRIQIPENGKVTERMEAYTGFAQVYDIFMDNVPYEEWAEYLTSLLREYGVESGLVLDLGCGTGSMTEILAADGYDMIGVDNSEDMLEIALEKKLRSGHDILYLLQDMREFELYGTVRAVVSVCDSVNYITEPEELAEVFRLVNNYLDPGGVFIFDFNTEYKYREILGEQTIAEDRGECSFIWDNCYYEEERINEYDLTLFIRDEAASDGERNSTGNIRRPIFSGDIRWRRSVSCSDSPVWSSSQRMMRLQRMNREREVRGFT